MSFSFLYHETMSERDINLFLITCVCINPGLNGKTEICTMTLDLNKNKLKKKKNPHITLYLKLHEKERQN